MSATEKRLIRSVRIAERQANLARRVNLHLLRRELSRLALAQHERDRREAEMAQRESFDSLVDAAQ